MVLDNHIKSAMKGLLKIRSSLFLGEIKITTILKQSNFGRGNYKSL